MGWPRRLVNISTCSYKMQLNQQKSGIRTRKMLQFDGIRGWVGERRFGVPGRCGVGGPRVSLLALCVTYQPRYRFVTAAPVRNSRILICRWQFQPGPDHTPQCPFPFSVSLCLPPSPLPHSRVFLSPLHEKKGGVPAFMTNTRWRTRRLLFSNESGENFD